MSAVAHAGPPSHLRPGLPDPVPVMLLARLTIDRHEQRRRLAGYLLVQPCAISSGGREIGAQAAVIDAIDERTAQF
jgi:hypothetical protein